MTGLNKTSSEWKNVSPRAVTQGSQAQAENVMTMAIEDIQELHRLWQSDVVLFQAAKALANHVKRSVDVGPQSKNPSREAMLWRNLRAALKKYEEDNLVHSENV